VTITGYHGMCVPTEKPCFYQEAPPLIRSPLGLAHRSTADQSTSAQVPNW
jgi:hypothetical protein